MARKNIIYKGLQDISTIIIDDTTDMSSGYFNITTFPNEFTAGKNLIYLKANPDIFVDGAYIDIEILDMNNTPIYNEVFLDTDSTEHQAIISVYITEDIPAGPGSITLVSTIYKDINNNILNTNFVNLRWTREIFIDQSKRNTTPILFHSNTPQCNITQGILKEATPNAYYYDNGLTTENPTIYNGLLRDIPIEITGSAQYKLDTTSPFIYFSTSSLITLTFEKYINDSSYIIKASCSLDTIENDFYTAYHSILPERYISQSRLEFNIRSIFDYISSAYMREDLISSNTSSIDVKNIQCNIINTSTFNNTGIGDTLEIDIPLKEAFNIIFDRNKQPPFYINISQTPSFNKNNLYQNKQYILANFTELTTIGGTIHQIKSYYKNTAANNAYILFNENIIDDYSPEFGFNCDALSLQLNLPQTCSNTFVDFKFEFFNPYNIKAKYILETRSLNTVINSPTDKYVEGDQKKHLNTLPTPQLKTTIIFNKVCTIILRGVLLTYLNEGDTIIRCGFKFKKIIDKNWIDSGDCILRANNTWEFTQNFTNILVPTKYIAYSYYHTANNIYSDLPISFIITP